MADLSYLQDFLQPVSTIFLNNDEAYDPFQMGSMIDIYTDDHQPDMEAATIILLGAGEERGSVLGKTSKNGPNIIRSEFYRLYNWHQDIKLADIGDLLPGASLADAYAAMKTVVAELLQANKTVIILGGSHDLTYAQYQAYASQQLIIEATIADALIDLKEAPAARSERFLMDILTEQPNYLRHYNHIGFQSYFVHPRMLETLDKLRFDCLRLGRIRENMEEAEPVLRHSDLFSLDINVIRHADAPANQLSANGFSGDEACSLAHYAGMSSRLSSFGIYNYSPEKDKERLTARQIAQMIWYFIDGRAVKNKEALLEDRNAFYEFHIAFADIETVFLKSKKTGRWWMQLPDREFVPCAYNDYLLASNNEMPERWLRHQERM